MPHLIETPCPFVAYYNARNICTRMFVYLDSHTEPAEIMAVFQSKDSNLFSSAVLGITVPDDLRSCVRPSAPSPYSQDTEYSHQHCLTLMVVSSLNLVECSSRRCLFQRTSQRIFEYVDCHSPIEFTTSPMRYLKALIHVCNSGSGPGRSGYLYQREGKAASPSGKPRIATSD